MKAHSVFICQQCGAKSPSFFGRCPQCGEWNSLVESVTDSTRISNDKFQISNIQFENNLFRLSEVKSQRVERFSAGFEEFDRVLGGGIVPGSIVLISGDPGIGKSTLLLQSAMRIAGGLEGKGKEAGMVRGLGEGAKSKKANNLTSKPNRHPNPYPNTTVLYVSGEESAQQVKIRADRIGKASENLYILPITSAEGIIAACEKISPDLLIIDSIQTMTSQRLTGSAGSVGQVRECAHLLQQNAKRRGIATFVVGHVTKEGNVAGPKVLEHLVDTVLNLEGDGMHSFRLLRSIKNRFGSTFEVGVFDMTDGGMIEVKNPSEIFLAQRQASRPGSAVTSTIAGGRPLLAEVQSLTTTTMFGVPARRVTGLDFSRMQVVIAALSRAAGLNLSTLDVYLNVAGGLKIDEPAADLAAALAMASAVLGKPIGAKMCVFGEVGLLGELRPVTGAKNRTSEARRIGFSDFVTPEKFKSLEEAVRYAVGR